MDTSEQYVKQCDKARKIQELRPINKPYHDGDWWISKRWDDAVACAWRGYRGTDDVWLPHLAQLQEMSGIPFSEYLTALACFAFDNFHIQGNKCQRRFYSDYALQFTSEEQLRLAFAMKEKYGKVWSKGEEWIHQNNI